MKFRKKPVVIDAMQYDGSNHMALTLWAGEFGVSVDWDISGAQINIHTLEGTMLADKGDWIIRGVKGEFYPCKPDIFAATYEPA